MPIYPKGFITKIPSEKAPEFIIANLAIKVSEFDEFMREHSKNGWINLTVKRGKDNTLYTQLDEFERKPSETVQQVKEEIKEILSGDEEYPEDEINPEDIPF